MKSAKLLSTILLILWWALASGQKAPFFISNGKPVNIDSFNRQVIAMMAELKVPGMSLAVIEDNKIVFYHTYGVRRTADGAKVNKRTVFDGCSLSKSYLAFVAYQVADEGKLDLDRPMYQYLPYEPLAHDERYKLITPRMILSHSSGIENWEEEHNPDTLEILSDPGTRFFYSGEGYQYLAKVIEKILNKPYEEYVSERVLEPLGLKNTYLKYKDRRSGLFHKGSPWNYATGHKVFGEETLFRNRNTFPAAGVHFTAEDYAKLIIAIFDKNHISAKRLSEVLTPIIRLDNSSLFYGPGFEVICSPNDTIIAHGGNKPGYKNQMFYSVPGRRGIVLMTNSDRGKSMIARLCEMTAGLNVDRFLEAQFYYIAQYPGVATGLLRIYDEKGSDAMFSELDKLKSAGRVDFNELNMLSKYFNSGGEPKIALRVLRENVAMYPDSPFTYVLLGGIYLDTDKPDSAFSCLMKAKSLHFNLWEIDDDLNQCRKMLAEAEGRKEFLVKIQRDNETMVRAEEYNAMSGVRVEPTADKGGGHNVAYIDAEDWMEYRIHVNSAGTYTVTFRVASMPGGGLLELRSGSKVLAKLNIASTNGWQKWESLSTNVVLPSGGQTLRVYAITGGFNMNWIKFSFIPG